MKLKFDASLPYQQEAIASIVDLFRGQTPMQTNFTVASYGKQPGLFDSKHGVGNRLELDEEEILQNLQAVQLRNGLPQSMRLKSKEYDFDVEMETGTGKTYVYLRTIFELHKNYGFSKFIIVVPSLAIKEGVYKSLQITGDHFKNLYENTMHEYFVYDSEKLEQVRSFVLNDFISVMVINIDAFRRSFADTEKENKANIIHRPHEIFNWMKPIELIQETHPFVIIDEPQSVDTTLKSKEAIRSLNPLCTLRYSATHVDKHHLVYKLDAVDSYELGLVKQIEVAGFESKNYHNRAYLKLVSVDNKRSPITAKVEIDKNDRAGKVQRKVMTVKSGDDLYEKSGGRDVYDGYIINEIYCEAGNEYVDFTSKPDILRLGMVIGDVDDDVIKEQQIRKTIEEHLDKELSLNEKGVKVLSLFFIDRVANYRFYDEEGRAQKGKYALMFEKHYRGLVRKPKYANLFSKIDIETEVEKVHDGYFSTDKKGKVKDSSGNTAADDEAYTLIMKDKERLLSFDTKLRFVFSHSALCEGWDNPNVFQICTLNETKSEVKKRQEIGRGLRLCVNQEGERLYGFEINTLTVMANESYEKFAEGLQNQYEEETGIRFGMLQTHSFANITVPQMDGSMQYLGQEASEALYAHFAEIGYVDAAGIVQDSLRLALKNKQVDVPSDFQSVLPAIESVCRKICVGLKIKNNQDKRQISLNKQVFLSPDFEELWNRIKYKTTYSVTFDSQKLIDKCCEQLQLFLSVSSAQLVYRKAGLTLSDGGVAAVEKDFIPVKVERTEEALPDIIAYLQNKTNLTRKTIAEILVKSGTLHLFKKNAQRYMEEVARILGAQMRLMIVDGIKYTKIGEDEFYAQELFNEQELTGYLSKNMIESSKSVYSYVVYDPENERSFAEKFETNQRVKVYAKLPDWFKIATPLGSYNPDWAVLVEKDGTDKLYFVLETKGNALFDSLRPTEHAKIFCGRKHFAALGTEVVFDAVDDFEGFIEKAQEE